MVHVLKQLHNGPSMSSMVVDFGTNRKSVCEWLPIGHQYCPAMTGFRVSGDAGPCLRYFSYRPRTAGGSTEGYTYDRQVTASLECGCTSGNCFVNRSKMWKSRYEQKERHKSSNSSRCSMQCCWHLSL